MNLSLVRRLAQKFSELTAAVHASSKHADSSLARALEVAVIGAPNVGKSLLTNQLVRAAVSSVSSKMDTTTQNVEAVLTEDNVQLVVCDSPGTIGLRHAKETMGRSQDDIILTGPELALQRAEHVLVVQDATATGDYIHHRVMHLLHRHSHIPSSLVINKVDLVSRRSDLLELTRILTNGRVAGAPIKTDDKVIGRLGTASSALRLHDDSITLQDEAWQEQFRKLIAKPTHKVSYSETKRLFMNVRGWSNFDAVFFVSSLTGEGIEPLRDHLKKLSQERKWRMDEMAVTTKNPQQICIDSVRAALLDTTPSNVAYKLKPRISEWKEEGEVLQIVVEINCDKERIGRLLVGKGGRRIAEIGKRVNDHMHSLFARQLFVRILVKCNGKIVDLLSS
ncbi:hypothetical protein OESDEN_11794 [Oesophagostomum dentatum]|uniref:GTPase Era, mitochondrial n=1 Tax=Oesophagostomum dentatum TaxID=61180 RepID=A0A0B1SY12_OESDE|nr:hypothetical protein OESDEN_11794 [Oesophagostomum dentatum]